jgi:Polyketide cyclase / dehydrase and lipid transport
MPSVKEAVIVPLTPEAASSMWTDLRSWPTFVEGFAHTTNVEGNWPEPGSKVVWESIPSGRGRVTETVAEHHMAVEFVTHVEDDALTGTQTAKFETEAEGTRVELELHYELRRGGPLRAVSDFLFIRRALADSLHRTLRRFAVEAAETGSR